MPRQCRYRLAGQVQLVHQRGHNCGRAFLDTHDYRAYRDSLMESCEETDVAVHAYALMSDHVLLLCTPRSAEGVSRMMQAIGRRYAYAFNHAHERSGAIWDGRYKACLVEPSRYVLGCYRFVETQVLRAGSEDIAEHRWSSYRAHALGEPEPLVIDHWVYRNLAAGSAERAAVYRDLCRLPLSDTLLGEIRHALAHCLVLGSERFKDEVAEQTPVRVRLGQPGRPPKQVPSALAGDRRRRPIRRSRRRAENTGAGAGPVRESVRSETAPEGPGAASGAVRNPVSPGLQ